MVGQSEIGDTEAQFPCFRQWRFIVRLRQWEEKEGADREEERLASCPLFRKGARVWGAAPVATTQTVMQVIHFDIASMAARVYFRTTCSAGADSRRHPTVLSYGFGRWFANLITVFTFFELFSCKRVSRG